MDPRCTRFTDSHFHFYLHKMLKEKWLIRDSCLISSTSCRCVSSVKSKVPVRRWVIEQEWAAPRATDAVSKGRTSPSTCSLIPTGHPQVGQVCEGGNSKHLGDTLVLDSIWRLLGMRRNPNEYWIGRRYGECQRFIECFVFTPCLLIKCNDGARAAKYGTGSQFFPLVVVSDLFENILVFVHLFVCFLCTEGKRWIDF